MSIGGSHYFVTFIDDYTRHTWACSIAKKSDFLTCFLKVKRTGRKIKCLRSDGRKEYFFDQFTSYLQKEEFDVNFRVDTHRGRTVWPSERIRQ